MTTVLSFKPLGLLLAASLFLFKAQFSGIRPFTAQGRIKGYSRVTSFQFGKPYCCCVESSPHLIRGYIRHVTKNIISLPGELWKLSVFLFFFLSLLSLHAHPHTAHMRFSQSIRKKKQKPQFQSLWLCGKSWKAVTRVICLNAGQAIMNEFNFRLCNSWLRTRSFYSSWQKHFYSFLTRPLNLLRLSNTSYRISNNFN